MSFARKELGSYGEALARQYLQERGCRILDVNFRNKLGELDLVVKDGPTVCFVEVKTRRSLRFGRPFEAVHPLKKRKLINLALSYLKFKFRSVDVLSRFDVISIYQDEEGQSHLEHIKNAFEC